MALALFRSSLAQSTLVCGVTTDILELPVRTHPLTVQGSAVTLPVGHKQIIALHVLAGPGPAIQGK